MKPCRKHRKPIVWLVLGALESAPAAELAQHFQLCEGCHRYYRQMLSVTQRLTSIQSLSEVTPEELAKQGNSCESASALRAPAPGRFPTHVVSDREWLLPWHRFLNWRIAVIPLCVLALGILMFSVLDQHPVPVPSHPQQPKVVQAPTPTADLAPTLANYRALANESFDVFDQFLTAQARKPIPCPIMFSATTVALLNISE